MSSPKHIHFMGIGGSGMSAVAQIAASRGYVVTGCDQQSETPYLDKVRTAGIPFTLGHDAAHLKDVDLLAVTPAVFYQNNTHPEVGQAKSQGMLITWEDFLGEHLHQGKFVICVAGTHGKSTTTSLAGLLLESAGLDPTVEVGATVKEWHNNVRIGKSQYFLSEADEFHNNFSTYRSDIILLTLLEFDHPEYFGTIENMLTHFQKFIDHRKPHARVIVNTDSPLIKKLNLPSDFIGYSLSDVQDIHQNPQGTAFTYQGNSYRLSLPGIHNVLNSLGIINLASLLSLDPQITKSVLSAFTGIGRRVELLGQKNTNFVYDDYANHPSSFAASLSAVKQLHPQSKIIAVIEPHTFSRLRSLLPELPNSVQLADEIIVTEIFASREKDPGDFTGSDIVAAMKHPHAAYIPKFTEVVSHFKTHPPANSVILVMGSGNSYKLSRQILEAI